MCHWIDPSARDSGSWTRTNGDIAFFRSSLCQNRRPAWGKSKWERFIMAFTLFCDGAHAKTRDGLGKIRFETRLSWRFRKKKRRSRQSRRLMGGLGKIEWEPVYHGDSSKKSVSRANPRNLRAVWENRSGNGLSWRFPQESGGYAKTGHLRPAGENFSGTRLSWRPPRIAKSDRRNDLD